VPPSSIGIRLSVSAGLLQNWPDFSSLSPSQSTMYWVASRDHIEITQLLLDRGANVDAAISDGGIALYWAASSGHAEIVLTLHIACEKL
jgi:hypothetical protein